MCQECLVLALLLKESSSMMGKSCLVGSVGIILWKLRRTWRRFWRFMGIKGGR